MLTDAKETSIFMVFNGKCSWHSTKYAKQTRLLLLVFISKQVPLNLQPKFNCLLDLFIYYSFFFLLCSRNVSSIGRVQNYLKICTWSSWQIIIAIDFMHLLCCCCWNLMIKYVCTYFSIKSLNRQLFNIIFTSNVEQKTNQLKWTSL